MPFQGAPEWQITAAYIVLVAVTAALMKLSSIAIDPFVGLERLRFLFLSPVFSTTTWRASAADLRLPEGAACLAGLATYHAWGVPLLERSNLSPVLLGFAAVIPLWLLVGSAGLIGQCLGLMLGRRLETIQDRPFCARSLSEFWGRRWNRWVGAWLRQTCFRPLRDRPRLGIVAAFGASAALHELLAAVPMWLVYRRSLFGLMTGYFLLQAAGLLLERRWVRRHPVVGRIWTWIWVIAPVPLVLNEATRRIFHFP